MVIETERGLRPPALAEAVSGKAAERAAFAGTDSTGSASGKEQLNLLQLATHEPFKYQAPQPAPEAVLPNLTTVDSCVLNFNRRLASALTDQWAILPGTGGLVFGSTAGSLAKHLALGPAVDVATRQFKVARAGVIWGLAGFASNYLGGAAASFFSTTEKEELCLQKKELSSLRLELESLRQKRK